jgi:hypothetical protein
MAETPERRVRAPETLKRAVRPRRTSVRYCEALVDEICARMAVGETWLAISQDAHMPSYTALYQWRKTKPGVDQKVETARLMGADALADEMLDTARAVTPATVGPAKVQIQTLQWAAGRASPARYGSRAGTPAPPGKVELHIRVRRYEKLYDDEGRAFLREILLEGEQ